MEPHGDEPRREEPKAPMPGSQEKRKHFRLGKQEEPRRFRILRLEERMPPGHIENQGSWSSIA
jgi:hypothetical protein